MNNSDSNGTGSIEISYGNVIDALSSLLTVVQPSRSFSLDTAEIVQSSDHLSSKNDGADEARRKKVNDNIKLDRATTDMISADIEKTKDNNALIKDIIGQLLQFSKSASAEEAIKQETSTSPLKFYGTISDISKDMEIINPITKLEWLTRICQENEVGVENLSMLIRGGGQFWTLFTSSTYATIDSLYQLLILWKFLGAYVNLKALVNSEHSALLKHDSPQVVHAVAEVQALLERRARLVGIREDPREDVPITAIISDFITPLLRVMDSTLA